jgi:hypothetical protein
LQPASDIKHKQTRAWDKRDLEPKVKPPVCNFLIMTFPVILASIEKSDPSLREFLPLAIKTFVF